ncbi:MAG TPA: hypothetical protein VGF99_10715, partial [Myxococcota bacterium]
MVAHAAQAQYASIGQHGRGDADLLERLLDVTDDLAADDAVDRVEALRRAATVLDAFDDEAEAIAREIDRCAVGAIDDDAAVGAHGVWLAALLAEDIEVEVEDAAVDDEAGDDGAPAIARGHLQQSRVHDG